MSRWGPRFSEEEFRLRVMEADERGRDVIEHLREHNPAVQEGSA